MSACGDMAVLPQIGQTEPTCSDLGVRSRLYHFDASQPVRRISKGKPVNLCTRRTSPPRAWLSNGERRRWNSNPRSAFGLFTNSPALKDGGCGLPTPLQEVIV